MEYTAEPIPKDVKVTIYCHHDKTGNEGFIENVFYRDAGIDLFIAKSWILQSELDGLMGRA